MGQSQVHYKNQTWLALFNLTVFSAYFYTFMEWLFFVTKPSSLSILPPLETALVLFVACGMIALPLLGILLLLFLPVRFIQNQKWSGTLQVAASVIPALTLTITALILFDNFSYTVIKFGVVTTEGFWRILYPIGFGLAFWWILRYVLRVVKKTPRKNASFPALRRAQGVALGLLAISTVTILVTGLSREAGPGTLNTQNGDSSINRPNILILGSDGLSANYLSVYGYAHETTPFLDHMAATLLLAENAFPNASSTTASTASVLTGKEPANVGVYRYPDILSGKDSFEHLPGILKQYGYTTVEIGTPYYVDAGKLNLLDGFDIVNNQSLNLPALSMLRSVLGNTPSTYFIWTMLERVSDRLLHIFFIKEMRNPFAEVNDPAIRMTDEEKVDQILDLLDQSDRPVFILTHLMDTHGPTFSSKKLAAGVDAIPDPNAIWDKALYEESIRSFDSHVEKIYTHLEQTGKLDNTILVIYTDHGFKYAVNHRIPVIIHFPKNEFAGTRENNVQIIDIPPTLVDYLGIPIPSWMTGFSLLKGEPPAERKIISIVAGSPKKIAPPFYQIKIMQVIVCQKWYALNVQENKWDSGNISGHTTQCEEKLLPPDEEIHQEILDYLKKHGFDISSIQ